MENLKRALDIIHHNGGNIKIPEGATAMLFPEYDGSWSVVVNGAHSDGRKWCETYDSKGVLVDAIAE